MEGFSFLTVTAQVTKSLIFSLLGGHDTFLIFLLLKKLKQMRAAECLRHVDLVFEAKSKFLLALESFNAKNCSDSGGGGVGLHWHIYIQRGRAGFVLFVGRGGGGGVGGNLGWSSNVRLLGALLSGGKVLTL